MAKNSYKVEGYKQMKWKERISIKEFRAYDIQEVLPCLNVLKRGWRSKPPLNSKALPMILTVLKYEDKCSYCTRTQYMRGLGIMYGTAKNQLEWLMKHDFVYKMLWRDNRKGIKYRLTNKAHDEMKKYILLWDREVQRLKEVGIL